MFHSLRIIFAGTPDFAAQHLHTIILSRHQVVGILTQPDRPAGRGNRLKLSPVKQLAKLHSITVFQPSSLFNPEGKKWVLLLNADIMVVVAYGLILPKEILDIPRFGCINIHGSLLPRWRGAAPIQRALLAGDHETGITITQMNTGMDTGDILYQDSYAIKPDDTSASLYANLSHIGKKAILIILDQIASDQTVAYRQDNAFATYADKVRKDEARIDWNLSAEQLERCIRAFNPWPISYFILFGKRIKVWAARVNILQTESFLPGTIFSSDKTGLHIVTGKGILTITKLQPEGKKVMYVKDFMNSRHECFMPGMIIDESLYKKNNNII